jgi:hypothetical protein
METAKTFTPDPQKPAYAAPHLTTRHIGTLLQQLGPAKATESPFGAGTGSSGSILQDALYRDDE